MGRRQSKKTFLINKIGLEMHKRGKDLPISMEIEKLRRKSIGELEEVFRKKTKGKKK